MNDVNDRQIKKAMDWLESEIDKHEGPKFIVSHYPLYSTGEYGAYTNFAERMEQFLDDHENS